MTVNNALKILDEYTKKKDQMKKDLLDRNMPWNHGDVSLYSFSKELAQVMDTDLVILNAIKKQIKPNCHHPKKLHDKDSDGNLYCMGCNQNL